MNADRCLYKIHLQRQIKTNEGNLFPIFRDWDEFHDGYQPKMVYATTVNPGAGKGPILHKERRYFITAVSGNVEIEIFNAFNKKIEKVYLKKSQEDEYKIAIIEPGVPIKINNTSLDETAVIINCPSKSWHPDNIDTWKWNSWEDYLNEQTKQM